MRVPRFCDNQDNQICQNSFCTSPVLTSENPVKRFGSGSKCIKKDRRRWNPITKSVYSSFVTWPMYKAGILFLTYRAIYLNPNIPKRGREPWFCLPQHKTDTSPSRDIHPGITPSSRIERMTSYDQEGWSKLEEAVFNCINTITRLSKKGWRSRLFRSRPLAVLWEWASSLWIDRRYKYENTVDHTTSQHEAGLKSKQRKLEVIRFLIHIQEDDNPTLLPPQVK